MSTSKRFNRLEIDRKEELHPAAAAVSAAASQRQDEHDSGYWMSSADAERRDGHYDNALRFYSRALELDRSLVPGWLGQIQMLILLEEYPEAELWGRKALELFRNHPGLLAGRAQAFCRTGDLKQAQVLCDASLAQQGQTAYCWVVRGELMLCRRDPIDPYCFDKAVQIDADWLLNMEIAAVYLHYNLAAKALQHCRTAVEKAPGHAYSWYMQGTVEQTMSLFRPAEKSFRRCLELKPNHVDAKRALDEMHKGRGFFSRLFRRQNI